jgi:hypothetical protein
MNYDNNCILTLVNNLGHEQFKLWKPNKPNMTIIIELEERRATYSIYLG